MRLPRQVILEIASSRRVPPHQGSPVAIGTPDETRVLVAARLLVARWSARGQLERIPEAGTVAEELRGVPGRHQAVASARCMLPTRLATTTRDAEAVLLAGGLCASSSDRDREAARRALAHVGDRYLRPRNPRSLKLAQELLLEIGSLMERLPID